MKTGWKVLVVFFVFATLDNCIEISCLQRDLGAANVELTKSLGSSGDEVRKAKSEFQKANRYLQILVGTSPETIFKVVDADIKAIDEGRALEVSDGLVLGGHPKGDFPNLYYMLEEALRLGASRAEVEKRFDRLEVLAKEGREYFGGNVDQQAASNYRLMKTMLFR